MSDRFGRFEKVLNRASEGVADEDQQHAAAVEALRQTDTFVLIVQETNDQGETVARLLGVSDFDFKMAAGEVLAHSIRSSVLEILEHAA